MGICIDLQLLDFGLTFQGHINSRAFIFNPLSSKQTVHYSQGYLSSHNFRFMDAEQIFD